MDTGAKVALGCGGGCLGMVVLCVLVGVAAHLWVANLPPEERAKLDADRKASLEAAIAADEAKKNAFLEKFHTLATRLPLPETIQEQLCPTTASSEEIKYLAVDYAFLAQFAGKDFVHMPTNDPHLWYRGELINKVQKAMTNEKDWYGLMQASDAFPSVDYMVVFMPTSQSWPVIHAENKTFDPGTFQGWAILVDAKKLMPLGQAAFSAQNSTEVRSLRVKVLGDWVGSTLPEKLEGEFTDRFWGSASQAIVRIRAHAGSTCKASHTDSFLPPPPSTP